MEYEIQDTQTHTHQTQSNITIDDSQTQPNTVILESQRPAQQGTTEKTVEKEPLLPLKTHIESSKNYPLNFEQFEQFINLTNFSTDPLNIARSFTPNIEKVKNMIKTTRHHLKDSKTKSKFTRLLTRIDKQLGQETTELSHKASP